MTFRRCLPVRSGRVKPRSKVLPRLVSDRYLLKADAQKNIPTIGSFGWSINRFAVRDFEVMENAKKFINLVNSDRFQVLRAETAGDIPALQSALAQVKNQEVLQVYDNIFSSPEVILQPRPRSRIFNNILEKNLLNALYGRSTPNAAIQAAADEIRQITTWD